MVNATYQYRNFSDDSFGTIKDIYLFDTADYDPSCSLSRDSSTLVCVFDGYDFSNRWETALYYSTYDGSSWGSAVFIKDVISYGRPNTIFAQYPILSGNETNIPVAGFAFLYYDVSDTNVVMYYSNVTWTSIGGDTPPVISNIQASPNPQLSNSYVNITCTVIDDMNLSTVKVNVSGPAGFTTINVSMNQDSGDGFYYNSTYSLVGTYTYFIWAEDNISQGTKSSEAYFDIEESEEYDVYVDDDAISSWYDATHVKTITEGIANASAGQTTCVYPGTYTGTWAIQKQLRLIAYNSTRPQLNGKITIS
jgi:hypothetical protein